MSNTAALLNNKVYEKGELVNLRVSILGTFFDAQGAPLPENASFVGPEPPTSYGPTSAGNFRIDTVYERPANLSPSPIIAARYQYKLSLQLPSKAWQVPIYVTIPQVISHMNLSTKKSGEPGEFAHSAGDQVFLRRSIIVATALDGRRELPVDFCLQILSVSGSRTVDNKAVVKVKDAHYKCRYISTKVTKGCQWKSEYFMYQSIEPRQ